MITPAFTSYWAGKAGYYMDAIDSYDVNDTVWRWRVIEELRYWWPHEYEFALAVRDSVHAHGGGRPMVEYLPMHYLPHSDIMYTLFERGLGSTTEEEFELDPADPVARRANNGSVENDFYPKYVTVERDGSKYLLPLFDEIIMGNYTGLMGSIMHTNRIHPYHRMRLGREALENRADIYATNSATESISQDPPDSILYHAPDLTLDGPVGMGGHEGRHDFWIGLHEADGIWIHNFSYRDVTVDHEAVWEEYVRALYLIKSEMRPYLAAGVKTNPSLTHNGGQTHVPGNHYIDINNLLGWEYRHDLALPNNPDHYSVINQTLFTIADVGYLIVTHSWDQNNVDFTVTLPRCIDSAQIVSGSSTDMNIADDELSDSFDGIDGRVYKLTFEDCP
ncbi:MAG: hypothetical protein HC927_00660 [Deltaproteobacteria bacterium]|nr:hypothetical protein [Deltaproteobacteria bacterium]